MKEKVFIIIPVFNRLNFTRRCLADIKGQKYKNVETIVIDDGSTDGTFEYVRRHYPDVHVIRGDGNWWWSRSVYEGVEYALGGSGDRDFVLLLNNDCFFEPNYLKRILTTAHKHPKAVIGSFCLTTSRPVRVVEAGVRIDWPTGIVYSVAEAISTDPAYYRNMEVIDQIDALPGKGTLVPIKLIRKIGNINYRRFPHYIADYEFANRAKKAGFELLVDIKAVVRHDWEATGYRSSSTENRLSYREAWTLLFGRKSMNNVIDWVNFLLLTCPRKYLVVNLRASFWRLLNGLTRIFPLIYLRSILRLYYFLPFGLQCYRLQIKIEQFPERHLKLWLYRLQIKIEQFPERHLKLWLYRLRLMIKRFSGHYLNIKK